MTVAAGLCCVLIRTYQKCISPFLPPACRFVPTCSCYALEAIRTHGAVRGGMLAVRRLARCGPWGAGGYDPVPMVRYASSGYSRAKVQQKQQQE